MMNTFIHSHSSLETYPIGKVYTHFQTKTTQKPPGGWRGGGDGVLRISSDRDDQRIFLGLKFSIPGFFCVVEFGKYSFGWLDLRRDLFWLFRTI